METFYYFIPILNKTCRISPFMRQGEYLITVPSLNAISVLGLEEAKQKLHQLIAIEVENESRKAKEVLNQIHFLQDKLLPKNSIDQFEMVNYKPTY